MHEQTFFESVTESGIFSCCNFIRFLNYLNDCIFYLNFMLSKYNCFGLHLWPLTVIYRCSSSIDPVFHNLSFSVEICLMEAWCSYLSDIIFRVKSCSWMLDFGQGPIMKSLVWAELNNWWVEADCPKLLLNLLFLLMFSNAESFFLPRLMASC